MIKEKVTMKLREELTKIESIPAENGNNKRELLKEALLHKCKTTLKPKQRSKKK